MVNWLEDTHKKLNALPWQVTLTQISDVTGLRVSWLSAFSRNEIEDPGIKKVQILNTYLNRFNKG